MNCSGDCSTSFVGKHPIHLQHSRFTDSLFYQVCILSQFLIDGSCPQHQCFPVSISPLTNNVHDSHYPAVRYPQTPATSNTSPVKSKFHSLRIKYISFFPNRFIFPQSTSQSDTCMHRFFGLLPHFNNSIHFNIHVSMS